MEYLPTLPSLTKARSREMCPQKRIISNTQTCVLLFPSKAQISFMFTELNTKGALEAGHKALSRVEKVYCL